MGRGVTKRQDIVTWYTPEEKHPEVGVIVVASVSGRRGSCSYDHAIVLASWYDDGDGYMLESEELDEYTIHAWCDLEPYRGER